MKFKFEIKTTETKEIDFPIPSYWKFENSVIQVTEIGIMRVFDNSIYHQGKKGTYFQDLYHEDIMNLHKSGIQISREDFEFQLNKTISTIKEKFI
jgi:hypothetical protein